jgi:hypothetical protein
MNSCINKSSSKSIKGSIEEVYCSTQRRKTIGPNAGKSPGEEVFKTSCVTERGKAVSTRLPAK